MSCRAVSSCGGRLALPCSSSCAARASASLPSSARAIASQASTTSTSPMARCRASVCKPCRLKIASSPWLLNCGYSARDNRTVHKVLICSLRSRRCSSLTIKPWSKRTLWATKTAPSSKSSNGRATSSKAGAVCTMASLMPVRLWIKGGMRTPGLTSVLQRATSTPSSIRTAAISVMRSTVALPPVVSRSSRT